METCRWGCVLIGRMVWMGTRPGGSGVDTWQQVEYLGITSLLIHIGNVRRLRLQPRLAVQIIVRTLLKSAVLVNYADVVILPVGDIIMRIAGGIEVPAPETRHDKGAVRQDVPSRRIFPALPETERRHRGRTSRPLRVSSIEHVAQTLTPA